MVFRTACIFILLSAKLMAQKSGQFEIDAGYGFYDAMNIGITCFFWDHTGLGISLGAGDFLTGNEKYRSLSTNLSFPFVRNHQTVYGNYHLWLYGKIYFWNLEDAWYKFQVIAINPAVAYKLYLNKRLFISFFAGPLFNIVVYNHRKTFEEVGWPHYFQFNPGMQLNYIISE